MCSLKLSTNQWGGNFHYPHFTDVETRAVRDYPGSCASSKEENSVRIGRQAVDRPLKDVKAPEIVGKT